MKQDIRDLFKQKSLPKKKLPDFHEDDFLEKLTTFNQKKKSKVFLPILKIAAAIVLIFSVSYYFLNSDVEIENHNQPEMLVEIQQIEKEYLKHIDDEWNSFIEIATDPTLIKKYEQKFKESDIDYKNITKKLKQYPNNINVLESLIDNLQKRLLLIRNIKEHLKELNQKNKSNETIYL